MKRKELILALVMAISDSQAWAGLQEDIAAKEAEIAKLRSEVEPLAAPITIKGSDLRVFTSLSQIANAITEINARPEEKRTIQMVSTSRNGAFWSDGNQWCNSHAKLDHDDSLRATAVLSNFTSGIRDDGAIVLGTRASVKAKIQVHLQFMGPRVSATIGICPICTHVNACPPGDGVGTSIGVEFPQTTIDMQLQITFKRSDDGKSIEYQAAFISPREVTATASIGLGAIGNVGYPMTFTLPIGPIANGKFGLLINKEGTIDLPLGSGKRTYSFELTPTEFVSNKSGITSAWKSTVLFK